jgi:hypothetical protein
MIDTGLYFTNICDCEWEGGRNLNLTKILGGI